MANVLVIDDDKNMCDLLSHRIQGMGHTSECAFTISSGLGKVSSKTFDLAFLDVRLPDGSGLDLLPKIRELSAPPEVIIITAEGDPDGAELAIKNGAWDYLEKPISKKDLSLSLDRVLQYISHKGAQRPPKALQRESIIGSSSKIAACMDLLSQAAFSDTSVLITGETGTGKELFAQAIHLNSARAANDFVVVDCAALPGSLVESTLFGHEKGAFTSADKAKEGLIKQADGGTLFLDEVGELPMSIQKSFLRVLQEHRFRPLGGKREIKSDFRVVAATNRSLEHMVQNGAFREDLLFRIKTLTIDLPPLKERPEDIREIATYHINRLCSHYGKVTKGLAAGFLEALEAYHWPGNVRELVNTLERVLAKTYHQPLLFPGDLPTRIRAQAARSKVKKKPRTGTRAPVKSNGKDKPPQMRDFLDSMRTHYLQELMSYADGNVKKACEASGLSRAHLYQLMKKHNISSPR